MAWGILEMSKKNENINVTDSEENITKSTDFPASSVIKTEPQKDINDPREITRQNSFRMPSELINQTLPPGPKSLRGSPKHVDIVKQLHPNLLRNGIIEGLMSINLSQMAALRTFVRAYYEVAIAINKLGKYIPSYEISLARFTAYCYGQGYGGNDEKKVLNAILSIVNAPTCLVYKYTTSTGVKMEEPKFTDDLQKAKQEWFKPLFTVVVDTKSLPNGTKRIMLTFTDIHPIFHHQLFNENHKNEKYLRLPNDINERIRKMLPKTDASQKIYNYVHRNLTIKTNEPEIEGYESTWLKIGGLVEQAKVRKGRTIKTLTEIFDGLIQMGLIYSYEARKKTKGKLWVLAGNKDYVPRK